MKELNNRGFVPLILAILVGIVAVTGIVGYRYAAHEPRPVVAAPVAPVAQPEVVEVRDEVVAEPVVEPSVPVVLEPQAAPVTKAAPVAKPTAPAKVETPTVPAPTVAVTVAPVVEGPTDAEKIAELLALLAADREAWTRNSEDAAGRRADALRALANGITPPTHWSVQGDFESLKALIRDNAAYYDGQKAAAKARYAELFAIVENAVRGATKYDEKFAVYRVNALSAASKSEKSASGAYASDLDGIQANLTIYETEERANELTNEAWNAGKFVTPVP